LIVNSYRNVTQQTFSLENEDVVKEMLELGQDNHNTILPTLRMATDHVWTKTSRFAKKGSQQNKRDSHKKQNTGQNLRKNQNKIKICQKKG
jgi:hypothetical protein